MVAYGSVRHSTSESARTSAARACRSTNASSPNVPPAESVVSRWLWPSAPSRTTLSVPAMTRKTSEAGSPWRTSSVPGSATAPAELGERAGRARPARARRAARGRRAAPRSRAGSSPSRRSSSSSHHSSARSRSANDRDALGQARRARGRDAPTGASASRPPRSCTRSASETRKRDAPGVGAHHPAQVDDDELGRIGRLARHDARERLARAEAELALQLDHDRRAMRPPRIASRWAVERTRFELRSAERVRRRARAAPAARPGGRDGGRDRARGRGRRRCRARCCRARRAAARRRRSRAGRAARARTPPETPLLAGSADRDEPLAGEVVHAAGGHHAEDVAHHVLADRALARERVDAAVRERRGDHREVAAVDRDRALAEVEVERGLRRRRCTPKLAQDVRDGAVAVPGRRAPTGRRPRRARAARPA